MDRINFVLTHFKEGLFDARRAYRRFRAMASDHANAWPRWWRPAVLSLSFAAIAALLFFRWQGAVTEYKAIDIVQSFTLKDGSRVTLAPGSTLVLRAHRNPRAVSMSGKVYFEVAHDE
ncbi:MAG: FecR domain-containing protein, partial [Bacteroidales bacterium]|nr:FecR domain-containing protein [Bacteroidales bacterium]